LVEPLDGKDLSNDMYIGVRVGDHQKLSRISSTGRSYRFPEQVYKDRKHGRLDVYQRVGGCCIGVDNEKDKEQEVLVNVKHLGDIRLRVGLDVKTAKSKKTADLEVPEKKALGPKAIAIQEYMETHGIEIRLNEVMQDLLREKPEDPAQFMADKWLETKHTYKMRSGSKQQPIAPFAPPPQDDPARWPSKLPPVLGKAAPLVGGTVASPSSKTKLKLRDEIAQARKAVDLDNFGRITTPPAAPYVRTANAQRLIKDGALPMQGLTLHDFDGLYSKFKKKKNDSSHYIIAPPIPRGKVAAAEKQTTDKACPFDLLAADVLSAIYAKFPTKHTATPAVGSAASLAKVTVGGIPVSPAAALSCLAVALSVIYERFPSKRPAAVAPVAVVAAVAATKQAASATKCTHELPGDVLTAIYAKFPRKALVVSAPSAAPDAKTAHRALGASGFVLLPDAALQTIYRKFAKA